MSAERFMVRMVQIYSKESVQDAKVEHLESHTRKN